MRSSIRFTVMILASAALALVVAPRPASAGNVAVTLNNTNLTYTEGNTLLLQWTFTNNTGARIFAVNSPSPFGPLLISSSFVSGDGSDFPDFASKESGTCLSLASLSAGSSCTVTAGLGAFSDGVVEDSDHGISSIEIAFFYICPNCVGDTDPLGGTIDSGILRASDQFQVTEFDPGAGPTPEPSPLFLLGTGLLGLGPLIRRVTPS